MKAYKGFDKELKCRSFQYEIGKTYEEDIADLCSSGFHACESPLDVLRYYAPSKSRYCEVELEDVSNKKDDDSKRVGKKITIGAEIGISGLAKAHFEHVKSQVEKSVEVGESESVTVGAKQAATAGEYGAATAGDSGAATAGDSGAATAGGYGAATAGEFGAATAGGYGAATAGYYGAATAGEFGAATAGNSGAATAGYSGAATAGGYGAATAGEYGAATAGYRGAATAGYRGAATSRGSSAAGKNGLSVARGSNVKVKGGLGAILVIAEEYTDSFEITDWKAVVVDGKEIKADTWYCLEDGELKEVNVERGEL